MSKYTKELLENQILDFVKKHGRTPQSIDCKRFPSDLASKNTFNRVFGSFNCALEMLGLKPVKMYRLESFTNACKHCGKSYSTKNKNSSFCSKACSITFNNKSRGVDRSAIKCKECGSEFNRNSDFCSTSCRMTHQMKNITVGELAKYEDQNRYRAIRDRCSSYYKVVGRPSSCQRCGYSLFIENCHIRDIKDFSEWESVWECNRPENIVFLCKNCHWEFDNGLLSLEEIK